MNIACVTWSYDEHQGISRCVVELTARLAARHEVHVYAAEVATAPRPGVEIHRVPLRHLRPHINDYDFFFRAGCMLRRARHDLVHAHFPVWYRSDVYTCHGLARMALRSLRGFPPAAKVDVPTSRMLPWYVQIPLYRYMIRHTGACLAAVSLRTRRDVAEESGRALREVHLVPNGVDLERFNPEAAFRLRADARRALGFGDDCFVLLWVGNHLRHKGLRHALAVVEQLPCNVTLLCVGADHPERVPDLAVPIDRLRSRSRVRFLSADTRIEHYYAASDVLLFPSLYESFGLVVLEAMAMGRPVVCPRTVAFADEHVVDGVNGCVVDHPWQIDAMADRVRRLMSDSELAARIGEAAARTARLYGWDAYLAATENVYESALAARARRG